MTLDDLLKECDRAEARWVDSNLPTLPDGPSFSLVVRGLRDGQRCRVFPGLMGNVVAHCGANQTLVQVKTADVRKAIAKLKANS